MKLSNKDVNRLTRFLVLFPLVFLAIFSPPLSKSGASTVITNGSFNGSDGWTIVQNGGSGMVFNGALRFSYATGEVSQSFTVNPGDTVEISFTVDNSSTNSVGRGAISDTWNVSLVSGSASATTGRTVAHNQEAFTLTLTVPSGASSATLDFSGMDNGYWAGVYGPVVTAVSAKITPAPTSLLVTSLADDGSEGTLRWAINQANATAGGIYDSITITAEGTITLTSSLPSITQSLTITGAGISKTIIDGNNQYRSIYNNGTRNISISDMTFKKGANATGGIVWSNNGTFTVTNVKFTESQNYAWYQQNNTVTTFESCQFTNLVYGIRSDYGSTPSVKSEDSAYGDRIYIKNSQFLNNSYGLATERFVKIENSVFSNNVVAAQLQGLNRIQVYGSTFNNNGTAIYIFSWIPTSWTPGLDNQVIDGNIFSENSNAININNYFSNGTKTMNGNNSNSWSTVRSNNYSENATIYVGSGFIEDSNTIVTTTTSTTSTTTTSTLPPTTTTSTTTTSTSTTTTTIEPESETTTTVEPEPETTTTVSPTTTTLIEKIFDPVEVTPVETPASEGETESDGPATSVPQYAPEQETTTQTDEPAIDVPKETQDAADAAVADIFDAPISDTKLADAVDNLIADAGTPEELTAVVNSLLDQELTDTQFATVIDSVFSESLSDENFSAAVDAVFADTSKLSDEQFDTAVQAVFDEPLSTEQFSAALEAVFDEPISDEKFDAIISAVLDEPLSDEQFTELVNVLESDTVTEEQVAAAVDSVIENGVTEDQATELATSEKVLQSIDGEQATEIFDAVEISNVTPEEAAALVAAVQDAPTEVREALESEINVFDGAIDTYVPLGSIVDVGTRRVVVAAAAAAASMTMGGASPSAPSAPSGSGGSGGGDGGDSAPSEDKKTSNKRRRK